MRLILLFLVLLTTARSWAVSDFSFRAELGQTEIQSNYFRVPRAASRVDFPDAKKQFTGRIYGFWSLDEENHLRLLIAPFSATTSVSPTTNIDFNGSTFSANTPTEVFYKFNSYRLSYIRQWKAGGSFQPHVGFTAKIRDAEIKLTSASTTSSRANVGFVPLINFGFDYVLSEKWVSSFDLDGSAASQGRALDGAVEVRYLGFENVKVGAGLRVLDGGVDTAPNENFTQLRTWFVSLSSPF